VLEHVQENDRVRGPRPVAKLLQRALLEVDAVALATGLDCPPRGLDAHGLPPRVAGGVEEETQVGANLEQAVPANCVAAQGAQHPIEQLAPAGLLGEVVLVDDVGVTAQDLLRGEGRTRTDHPAVGTAKNVVVLRERPAGAAVLRGLHVTDDVGGVDERQLLGAARDTRLSNHRPARLRLRRPAFGDDRRAPPAPPARR
jgi:hypothetical protein